MISLVYQGDPSKPEVTTFWGNSEATGPAPEPASGTPGVDPGGTFSGIAIFSEVLYNIIMNIEALNLGVLVLGRVPFSFIAS